MRSCRSTATRQRRTGVSRLARSGWPVLTSFVAVIDLITGTVAYRMGIPTDATFWAGQAILKKLGVLLNIKDMVSENAWAWAQKKAQKRVDEQSAVLEAEKARARKSHAKETEGAGPSRRRDD